MKKKLLVLLFALSLGSVTQIRAAFVVTKTVNAPATTQQIVYDKETTATNTAAATDDVTTTVSEKTAVKKHSFLHRLLHRADGGKDVIPLGLYIVMAILPLGWLAMGINDDFTDFPWILSLILYILGYIPGLICTLLFIPRYY